MKTKILLWTLLLIIFLRSGYAWIDCTPSPCDQYYSDEGVSCEGSSCIRICSIGFCENNWTEVFQYSLTDYGDHRENTINGLGYTPVNSSSCYRFTYDGSGATSENVISVDGYEGLDCDTEVISGFFDNTEVVNPWFENITGYLGNTAFTPLDYWLKIMRTYGDDIDGDDDLLYNWDEWYRNNISGIYNIFCAPNIPACNNINTKCAIGCYNHSTSMKYLQGYYDDLNGGHNDPAQDHDNNLYILNNPSRRCGNDTEPGDFVRTNNVVNITNRVYSAKLYTNYNNKECNRINLAPMASNVRVDPIKPSAAEDLMCLFNYTDPENQTESGSYYEWYKNNAITNFHMSLLPKENLSIGDVWYCKVNASDGISFGNSTRSQNNVTVLSTIKNPKIYFDNLIIWNITSYFNGPEYIYDLRDLLQNSVDNCIADQDGYCNIRVDFSSDAIGVMNITDLEIYYILNNSQNAINCGANITNNITLTNNIHNCEGAGINILSDNILLDCNGHSLSGAGMSFNSGINIFGKKGIIIRNCNISGFSNGIFLEATNNTIIANNSISNSSYYGINIDSNSNNNHIANNTEYSGYGGLFLGVSNNSQVIGNAFINNQYYGINLMSSNNIIKNNIIKNNSQEGIRIYSGSYNNISNNTVINNYKGFSTVNTNNLFNYISNNNFSNNIYAGIEVFSKNTFLENNHIDTNWFGIYLQTENSRIINNRISNSYEGLYCNNCNNISVFGNLILSNSLHGVMINAGNYSNFWNNNFSANSQNAFESDPEFTNNINWNISDIGNYWDDFSINPGYPFYYEVSGPGTGIDYHPVGALSDADSDGVADSYDNCPYSFNPDQLNSDNQDGGDVCDICPADATDMCNVEDVGSEVIDNSGGIVENPSGTVSINIPEGSLENDTSISITPDSSIPIGYNIFENTNAVSSGYIFTPEGLIFNNTITVIFSYNDSFVQDENNLHIYWFNTTSSIWQAVNSIIDPLQNTITFQINHFSEYVIAETLTENHAPFIEPINNITINEGQNVTIIVEATDPDNDSLEYSINDSRFQQNNNIFIWQTQPGDAGNYSFIISVSDGQITSIIEIFVKVQQQTCYPYVPGDANGNGQANGIDVTYLVRYFKAIGPPPPYAVQTPNGTFYPAADSNGNCQNNGIDVTYLVAYFKGMQPRILYCPTYPPCSI